MRDFLTKFFAVCGVLTMFGLLQACFSDSNADSKGLTRAQVEAMIAEAIAPLQAEITALKSGSDSPYTRLYVREDSSTAMMKLAAADEPTTLADLGDPIDCEDEGPWLRACRVVTPTGFIAKIPLDRSEWRPAPLVDLVYALPDCQGQPYVHPLPRPVVTSTKDETYQYVPTDVRDTFIAVSYRRIDDSECLEAGDISPREWAPVETNDPAESGIESLYTAPASFSN